MVAAGIVAFIAYHGIAAWNTHEGWNTYTFDLGVFDQGMWLMSRFKNPFVTLMGRNLFGDHTSFILIPLVPLYWIAPSVKVLLFVQVAAVGMGAWPVFLIARDLIRDERIAAALAGAFLLQPVVAWAAADQFHPDAFEIPLLLFALWFMIHRRWPGFYAFVGLALLVKEDVPLLTLALGLYVAVRHSRRVGLVTAGVSIGYFAFALAVLHHFNGVGTLNGWRIPFGGIGGLLETTVRHPGSLLAYLVGEGRPWYLWQLVGPLALLPLFAVGEMLIAFVPIASNVISTFAYQHDIEHHYGTLIVPVLMLATAFAIARLDPPAIRVDLTALIVVAAIAGTMAWGPKLFHPAFGGEVDVPDGDAIHQAIEVIPPDASVAAYYRFTPHMDHRVEIYELTNPFRAAYWGTGDLDGMRLPAADTVEYVIVPTLALEGDDFVAVRRELSRSFEIVYDRGGVQVFRRAGS